MNGKASNIISNGAKLFYHGDKKSLENTFVVDEVFWFPQGMRRQSNPVSRAI
jgi:hypothetical protein